MSICMYIYIYIYIYRERERERDRERERERERESRDGTAFHPDCLEVVIKTCMKLTSAEFTVENS
jgi:hypothetical protein